LPQLLGIRVSRSRNCGRLLIAATQSSRLLPTKVRSHGNNVRDVIIAHVISADAQIYRRGNSKVILGPAGRALRARPAGKKQKKSGLRDDVLAKNWHVTAKLDPTKKWSQNT